MRIAVAAACLLGGAATGVTSVLVHGRWWGLALALAATAATIVALPGGWWRRLPFVLGWVLALGILLPERPEGDYLVAGDAPGYALLAAAVAVLVSGVVGLREHPTRSADQTDDSGVARPSP